MFTPVLIKTPIGNFTFASDPGEPLKNVPRKSVTEEEAEILKGLVLNKNVLEIGTGLGVSTRAIALTAKTVVSVDIDSWTHRFEFPPNVVLLSEIPTEQFDLVFIDGFHERSAVYKDIKASKTDLYILHDCDHLDVLFAASMAGLVQIQKFNTACDMRMFK